MTDTYSVSGDETLEDIQKLISCSDDTLIEIWSMQHSAAIEHLHVNGSLLVNADFAFSSEDNKRGKKAAYSWMQAQMGVRLTKYQGELPIWRLLSRPQFSNRQNDKLLRLEIPKSRILISFYEPWRRLLCIMAHLIGSESHLACQLVYVLSVYSYRQS